MTTATTSTISTNSAPSTLASIAAPKRRTIVEWFDSVSELLPQRPALFVGGETISYQELRARSRALAVELVHKHGVRPEDRVGVLVERSANLVVALLAIMEARAVYMPIDPTLPRLRIAAMLGDAQPRALLVSPRTDPLAAGFSLPRILMGEPATLPFDASPRLPSPRPDQVAYLLFSSGTTGRPKAVMGTHRCLTNLVAWQLKEDGFPSGARVLQYSPMGFDVSLQEVFTALLSGGSLALTPDAARADLLELSRFVIERAIQVLYLPVIVLNELFGRYQQIDWSGHRIERIIVAGEPLRISPGLRAFLRDHPRVVIHNHYGPTETHVATGARFGAAMGALPDLPPIGRPVAQMQAYLLDAAMKPVEPGATGELYLAGEGVARGYFGQPGLTSERFVPDPLLGRGVCYRTGDLARLAPDGQLEFLRRRDAQVKVKGYRVEPMETASTLLQSGLVEDVVVRARPGPAGTVLAIYVVRRGSQDLAGLRRYLAERLPDYLVPSEWYAVEALPRTDHGKIDERALERLVPAQLEAAPGGASPAPGAGERPARLAALWTEILGRPVGIDDDFFELGGESLRGMQLLALVHRELGIVLRLRDLFDAPTVRGMAQVIDSRAKGDAK